MSSTNFFSSFISDLADPKLPMGGHRFVLIYTYSSGSSAIGYSFESAWIQLNLHLKLISYAAVSIPDFHPDFGLYVIYFKSRSALRIHEKNLGRFSIKPLHGFGSEPLSVFPSSLKATKFPLHAILFAVKRARAQGSLDYRISKDLSTLIEEQTIELV